MPFSKINPSVLNERSIIVNEILDIMRDMEIRELEEVEKYCNNYHDVFGDGENTIVTEITVE